MDIISLFAGCGGLDAGFERAGFNIVWANEYDKSIHDTYRHNHPNTHLNTSDIRLLSGKNIPDCDGIIGGPPCQAWSEGGKNLGLLDFRGQLFWDYIRIVREKKPKFFLIENVQGILDERHVKSLSSFLKSLQDAGYNVSYKLLNAADYNVPQDRFRVFFIGLRNDLPDGFVFPEPEENSATTLRDAIGDITEKPRFYTDELVEGLHPLRANHDVYTGNYDTKYMSRNRVRAWDEPSFTIQAQARNTPQHPDAPKMTYISPSERIFAKGFEHLYRRLSVRECARIQSFSDDFLFLYSDVKDGYKMVGNAVPPRLAWHLAMQIQRFFTGIEKQSSCTKHAIAKDNCLQKQRTNNPDSVLICLVKSDDAQRYHNCSAKLYCTGKKFPSTIKLNKLRYFVPYIKGKGIRDLYLIKVARVGTKHEARPDSDDNSLRIVFEIEFVKQLFEDYRPLKLKIWETFTDTTLEELTTES